jgi:hypothetical protein
MVFAGSALAQNPLPAEVKQAYNGIKGNLTRMAAKMPEEHYAFKPVPEIRTFGELVAHVADSQTRNCSAASGQSRQPNAASKTSKADLVAALAESFATCDAAFDALSDTSSFEKIKTARGERSRIGTLVQVVTHSNEEYGYMAVYLRLKGIVPPSSEKR